MAKKYKNDIDGVSLMRFSFPEEQNKDAISRVMQSKPAIKAAAKHIFYKNVTTFGRVGMRLEDIESILTSNAYVRLAAKPMAPKILKNFLKQRGIKLAQRYKTLASELVEEAVLPDDVVLEDLISDYSNPENILMAKEELAQRSSDIQRKLVKKSQEYVLNFVQKNRATLERAGINVSEVTSLVNSNAVEFASAIYRNRNEINFNDFKKFKRLLSVKMSRFVKDLNTVNG